jgi:hypothetical protein
VLTQPNKLPNRGEMSVIAMLRPLSLRVLPRHCW